MEGEPDLRRQGERLRHLRASLEEILGRTDDAIGRLASEEATPASVLQLERLRGELEKTVQDYVVQAGAFADQMREYLSKIEEAKRMAEQSPKPARNQARIQELSEKLARDLRLERVDNAIKELLDFLSDTEFFAANASTGRRRRLRSLQNAIDKALEKK